MAREDFDRGDSQAAELVSEFLDEHPGPTSDEFETEASEVARRAELEHPVNRAPSTIAAASIYLVGHLVGEKLHQHEVSAASGVSETTIGQAYAEIADHEDIPIARNVQHTETSEEPASSPIERFLNRVVRRD